MNAIVSPFGHCYGRKPAVHTLRTTRSAIVMARHLAALGTPPANSDDYTTAVEKIVGGPRNWGMFGNDRYGDCVQADDAHTLMLRTANAGTIVIPTEADIDGPDGLYHQETGFDPNNPSTDQGTDEASDCAFLVSTGLLGHKATATGFIDPANLDHLRWAIQLFGAVKLGILVTDRMEQAFAGPGASWDGTCANGQVLGGHDVPLVRYYADGSFDCITWSRRFRVEASFITANFGGDKTQPMVDEAHGLVFADFVERASGTTPAGFSLRQLVADLPAVA